MVSWLIKPIGLFHKKIRLFINGRKKTFDKLRIIKKEDKVIWFHCASLGEFEQGRPVIEKLKHQFPNNKIVLTFFSPSGYEIRKDYEFADVVCYLPLDTKRNANKFIAAIHPEIAIFVKYEFWPNILKVLSDAKIETLLISGIFRKEQAFFKSGIASNFMKKSLTAFNHFFVQDENSKKLLNSIGFNNVTQSGDTRFDRVFEITKHDNTLEFISDFVADKHILVAGSTWKQDEEILVAYINNFASDKEKFIIAPHNIKDIVSLKKAITKKVALFSDTKYDNSATVFIVDTIGILTKMYHYADVAYVGGGFGNGIHNILEPATFGVPIIIGPKFNKFKEAIDLIALKGCFVVKNEKELKHTLQQFIIDTSLKAESSQITKNYVKSNTGATNCIISYIKKNSAILQS